MTIAVRKETVTRVVKQPTRINSVQKQTEINVAKVGRTIIRYAAGFSKLFAFALDDWVLTAGQYILTIQHMLESENAYIGRAVSDAGDDVEFQRVVNENANTIKIYMPATTDLRFAGKVIINKV